MEADFYAASEKIEGWKVLLGEEQVEGSEGEAKIMSMLEENNRTDDVNRSDPFDIPPAASVLPPKLVQQLEAYRQLIVNRWRPERVAANSTHYFSRQVSMWSFFANVSDVHSVSELRLDHVTQFIQQRIGEGRSASTVNGSLSMLRCFLLFLREDGVEVHPSLEHIKRLKGVDRLPRYMSTEQVQRVRKEVDARLLTAPDEEQKHDALLLRAVFHLLWQGGLRIGEVEELRFSDFYISTANHAKRLFVRDSKWRKGRAVYLTDVQLSSLRAYLSAREKAWIGGYVFVRNHQPLRRNYLSQHLRRLGRRVQVHISPHRLRHTFGTQLLNVGCPVTSIQKLLGHSSLNTTMNYARAFDQTVMLDYFNAVNTIEAQPGGAWYGIDMLS